MSAPADPVIKYLDVAATTKERMAARGDAISVVGTPVVISFGNQETGPWFMVNPGGFVKFCGAFEQFYVRFAGVVGIAYILIWPEGSLDEHSNISVYAP